MAGKACDYEDMPTHPGAPKTVARKASARGGHNSFVKGGKGKKKGRKKRIAKK